MKRTFVFAGIVLMMVLALNTAVADDCDECKDIEKGWGRLTDHFPNLGQSGKKYYDALNGWVGAPSYQKTATELLTESGTTYLDFKKAVQTLVDSELKLEGVLRTRTTSDKKSEFLSALSSHNTLVGITYTNIVSLREKLPSSLPRGDLLPVTESFLKSLHRLDKAKKELTNLNEDAYKIAADAFLDELLDGAMKKSIALHHLDGAVSKPLFSKEPESATVQALFAYTSGKNRAGGDTLTFQYRNYVWEWKKQETKWQDVFKSVSGLYPKYAQLVASLRSNNYEEGVAKILSDLSSPSDGLPMSNKFAVLKNDGTTIQDFYDSAPIQEVLTTAKKAN